MSGIGKEGIETLGWLAVVGSVSWGGFRPRNVLPNLKEPTQASVTPASPKARQACAGKGEYGVVGDRHACPPIATTGPCNHLLSADLSA